MSALPEAKLAREAEIAYQMICMATDYDCWHSSEDVNVEMVMGHMKANSGNANLLISAVLDVLAREEHKATVQGKHVEGQVREGVKWITKAEGRGEEGKRNVEFLFPGIWD